MTPINGNNITIISQTIRLNVMGRGPNKMDNTVITTSIAQINPIIPLVIMIGARINIIAFNYLDYCYCQAYILRDLLHQLLDHAFD